MITMPLSDLSDLFAQPLGVQGEFVGVSTDTRTIEAGNLFVALVGDNFDGHAYLQSAKDQGAVTAIVSQKQTVDLPQIVVNNTREALGVLAKYWRAQFDGIVVGLTGSNGKTTVKEMLARILENVGKTLATQGNLNNDIGVPQTLFRLGNEDFAVIEMGANAQGEIAYLSSLVMPDVALVNNTGVSHVEGFGGVEGVVKGKGELFDGLSAAAKVAVNLDDKSAPLYLDKAKAHSPLGFGLQQGDVRLISRVDENVTIVTPQGEVHSQFALLGMHNVQNALAATAVALQAGVSVSAIEQGLSQMQAVKGRLERVTAKNKNLTLINDCYNANPTSLAAGVEAVSVFAGEKVLALGAMAELGKDSKQLHFDAGKQAKAQGIAKLFAIGAPTQAAVDGFGEGGECFSDKNALIEKLNEINVPTVVLVKGSRSAGLESVIEGLM